MTVSSMASGAGRACRIAPRAPPSVATTVLLWTTCTTVRGLTTWTIPQKHGPNHLGLRCNAFPGHQRALITSNCVPFRLRRICHQPQPVAVVCAVLRETSVSIACEMRREQNGRASMQGRGSSGSYATAKTQDKSTRHLIPPCKSHATAKTRQEQTPADPDGTRPGLSPSSLRAVRGD